MVRVFRPPPQAVILTPGERHWEIFRNLLTAGQATALSIKHGCTFATTDRDFARSPGLTVINLFAANSGEL